MNYDQFLESKYDAAHQDARCYVCGGEGEYAHDELTEDQQEFVFENMTAEDFVCKNCSYTMTEDCLKKTEDYLKNKGE